MDIGGTTGVGGLIEGSIIKHQVKENTYAQKGGETTLSILKKIIGQLKSSETKGIGIGVPSVVDRKDGIAYNVQNIKDWEEVHLKEILETEFNIPVYIDNDQLLCIWRENIW